MGNYGKSYVALGSSKSLAPLVWGGGGRASHFFGGESSLGEFSPLATHKSDYNYVHSQYSIADSWPEV